MKTSKQKLWDECDALWSKIVKARYKGRCGLCGRLGCDPHHIVRKNGMMRWHIPNGLWVCRRCHSYIHDYEYEMNIIISSLVGADMMEHLIELSRIIKQHKEWELAETKESLKEELERMKT